MSNDESVREIEVSMEDAKAYIEAGDAMNRLRDNKDFQKIILEGYFKEEAIRLISLKADHLMRAPEDQEFLIKCMDGIGCLQNYIRTVMFAAQQAVRSVQASDEALEEIELEDRQAELDREAGAMQDGSLEA